MLSLGSAYEILAKRIIYEEPRVIALVLLGPGVVDADSNVSDRWM